MVALTRQMLGRELKAVQAVVGALLIFGYRLALRRLAAALSFGAQAILKPVSVSEWRLLLLLYFCAGIR